MRLVEVSEDLLGAAYRVIANGTLWPLVHGLFDATYRPVLDRRWHEAWAGYRAYNAAFADEIVRVADEGATVVVNDYHLALCGAQLAKARPDLRTIYFSHTPFCGPDELEILPTEIRREFLQGLCSFGTTAFHTRHWAGAFEQCVSETLMTETELAVIPLGVDAEELRRIADTEGVERSRNDLVTVLDGRRLIFRSDRVDPAKNIVRGFLAFEALLEEDESLVEEVVFSARLYSSRTEIPEYIAYRNAVEQICSRINERFSSARRQPIDLEIADDLDASIAAMTVADVLFVNPVRDGMNLVAKEGAVLTRTPAALGLSVRAGAFEELGAFALPIEPFDIEGTANVLRRALELDERERRCPIREPRGDRGASSSGRLDERGRRERLARRESFCLTGRRGKALQEREGATRAVDDDIRELEQLGGCLVARRDDEYRIEVTSAPELTRGAERRNIAHVVSEHAPRRELGEDRADRRALVLCRARDELYRHLAYPGVQPVTLRQLAGEGDRCVLCLRCIAPVQGERDALCFHDHAMGSSIARLRKGAVDRFDVAPFIRWTDDRAVHQAVLEPVLTEELDGDRRVVECELLDEKGDRTS